jgi:hypothetical protein
MYVMFSFFHFILSALKGVIGRQVWVPRNPDVSSFEYSWIGYKQIIPATVE